MIFCCGNVSEVWVVVSFSSWDCVCLGRRDWSFARREYISLTVLVGPCLQVFCLDFDFVHHSCLLGATLEYFSSINIVHKWAFPYFMVIFHLIHRELLFLLGHCWYPVHQIVCYTPQLPIAHHYHSKLDLCSLDFVNHHIHQHSLLLLRRSLIICFIDIQLVDGSDAGCHIVSPQRCYFFHQICCTLWCLLGWK